MGAPHVRKLGDRETRTGNSGQETGNSETPETGNWKLGDRRGNSGTDGTFPVIRRRTGDDEPVTDEPVTDGTYLIAFALGEVSTF